MLEIVLAILGFLLLGLLAGTAVLAVLAAAGVVVAGNLLERLGDLLIPGRKTGLGATGIVGESGIVVRGLTPAAEGSAVEGTVQVAGELWQARSDAGHPLAEGRRVQVVAVEGMVAIVEPTR